MSTIQFRRNTAANATSSNPTLAAGEPGFETDTGKVKIGDGVTQWNSLAYVGDGYQPLDADLTALAALSGTNTIYYRSAANTWSSVTIGANLTFSAGTLAATGGDVVGPGSATDNAICRFDTTSGKLIQNSAITVSDGGILQLDGTGERMRITNGTKYLPIEYTSGVLIFGHTYDYASNTNPEQYEFRYRSGGGYGVTALKLNDIANGYVTILNQTGSGQLYITNGAGTPGGLTLGTRYNPADGEQFIAGYQTWYTTGVNRFGIGLSPIAQLDVLCGAASNVVAKFKAATSQTGKMIETRSSANALEFDVAPGGNVSTIAGYKFRSGSADPTNTDITDGFGSWWRNTTAGEVRYWVNVAGTMLKSAALT